MLNPSAANVASLANDLWDAAHSAVLAIPPAFPLDQTVASNPFLGQIAYDLADTAARLERVAGVRVTLERSEYLQQILAGKVIDEDLDAALTAFRSPLKPGDLATLKAWVEFDSPPLRILPTVADLAADSTGIDWPNIIARSIGLWAAGYFDRGQALWTPAAKPSAFAAWREWASNDLTPELAGLAGFCSTISTGPDTTDRAIIRAGRLLGLDKDSADTAFHRLLVDLGGWAQHARWILWQAQLAGGSDATLVDLLAIRLVWDQALLDHVPAIGPQWEEVVSAHRAPVSASADQVVDAILQDACERADQRRLISLLTGSRHEPEDRPSLQAAFCIDVRSEVFRRALESCDSGISTIGFAGFFGLPVAHRPFGSDVIEAHLPVLLTPSLVSSVPSEPGIEENTRVKARSRRAWGRFRQAAVSSFAFVEAAGPLYGAKLIKDALAWGPKSSEAGPMPQLQTALSTDQKVSTAAAVLRAMSMTSNHARLVLILGHGAQITNNPHESAYHCGACGGHSGEVSARLLAWLLNDADVRAGLPAMGIELPMDTLFMAGLHNTTTDIVTLYADGNTAEHASDIAAAKAWLGQATAIARAERAPRLPGATAATLAARALNWAEVRPEWGLAGCSTFIAAPRSTTRSINLAGRAFLHSYDWRSDPEFSTLELILTAPVVVASWISLQYYGSSVAPSLFGSGNKLIHNVTGGIGVLEGNGGRLRAGLPWQALHDGLSMVHQPLRLSVMIEAPQSAIADVLARHDDIRQLFDNGWLSLFALASGRPTARYEPGLSWKLTNPDLSYVHL